MANATLTITATLVNGGRSRNTELELLNRATTMALQQVTAAGGTATSGTATAESSSGVSATFSYSPVASS
jgi:hypothetical protein